MKMQVGRLLLAIALLAAAAALSDARTPERAGADTVSAAASPNGRPVHVYGDSVLLGAKPQIEQRLTNEGWRPTVKASVGANMPTVIGLLAADRPVLGDVVVLGVGNNYFGNADVFRAEIDQVMTILTGISRVIWLNLREFEAGRADANRELALALDRWPNLEIADWNSLSLTQPNTFWNDGLHLRPEGAALMAQLVSDRLQAFLLGAPRATVPITGPGPQPVSPHVYGFGAPTSVQSPDTVVDSPFVGVASTPSGEGYWLATADGEVLAVGDAPHLGDASGLPLKEPIVDIASARVGTGYWLVARDGGVFSYGAARFHGSTGDLVLNQPIVGMEPTRDGEGYWLAASDGGVFSFGSARFLGSTGNLVLNQPIVGMRSTLDGRGYWLFAFDGGVFSFGSAPFHGSLGAALRFWPVTGMLVADSGSGYLLMDQAGEVYEFGAATSAGDRAGMVLEDRFFGIAERPAGYWLAAQRPA